MAKDRRQYSADKVVPLIVYEDRDLLVVNKPPGMLTASGPRDKRPTLWGNVQARAEATGHRQQMGIIHRLDRDASGLLVFSKNDDAYQSLKAQFFRHTVERIYMAVTHGRPSPLAGVVDNRIAEWKDGTVHKTKQPNKGERAVSRYETISTYKNSALVRVKLETGRKHQIRVHLAGLGSPIVGDDLYNLQPPKSEADLPLMLVAMRLCFDHPRTGKRVEFEIELPRQMRDFLRIQK